MAVLYVRFQRILTTITENRIKHQTEHAMETKRIGAPKLHCLQISSLAQALIFKTSSPEFKP